MRVRVLAGVLVLAGLAGTAVVAGAATNPPASFPSGFLPVVYNATNGAVRVVKPWGVAGVSDPACTPPVVWQLAGVSYDPTLCNTGGSFDAKNNEFYTEVFSAGLMATSTGAMAPYLAIAYNSSTGAARIVPEWNVAAGTDPTCTPPVFWQVSGVTTYDSTACNSGGSFATKANEFYTELGNALPTNVGPTSVGLSPVLTVEDPPATYVEFIPIAYDASSGKMRFLRPWGVAGQSIPDCTPPAVWQVPGASYAPTACNTGGVFDALTSEVYTEFFPAS